MNDVFLISIVATIVFLITGLFIIFFMFFFQKKQRKNKEEKAAIKTQFEQEIMRSQTEIKEETMKYISRELHDNVVQMLSLVKIQLNNLTNEQPQNEKLANSKSYITSAISDLRALSKTLNTDNILAEGLAESIKFELERIKKLAIFDIEFSNRLEVAKLDKSQEIIIFRIFQELIQNIIKHANAKKIVVLLEESKNMFNLVVEDDGIGFDMTNAFSKEGFEGGRGLVNMVYRAGLLGGTFEVSKSISGGTKSILTIPLANHYGTNSPHR